MSGTKRILPVDGLELSTSGRAPEDYVVRRQLCVVLFS